MARITLLTEQSLPDQAPLVARIKGARGKLINLYAALLHAPEVASTWFDFINSLRDHAKLEERLRELAILRVAQLNGSDYVYGIHSSGMAQKAGVTQQEIDALRDWRASGLFAPRERALLAYVDAMTRDVDVPDDVFEDLRPHFDESRLVELTILVACYNMHTRFLRALRVDPEKP